MDSANSFLSVFQNQFIRIISTSQPQQEQVTVAPIIEQRKNRPLAPHLTIYAPQLTWYMSAFHRITGGAVAVGKEAPLSVAVPDPK